MPALGEWIPSFRQMLQDRADEKQLLSLVNQAEEIAKQNERRFNETLVQKLRSAAEKNKGRSTLSGRLTTQAGAGLAALPASAAARETEE